MKPIVQIIKELLSAPGVSAVKIAQPCSCNYDNDYYGDRTCVKR